MMSQEEGDGSQMEANLEGGGNVSGLKSFKFATKKLIFQVDVYVSSCVVQRAHALTIYA
jgi:hypothetical protein